MQNQEDKRETLQEAADPARAAFAAALKKHRQENDPDADKAPAENRTETKETEVKEEPEELLEIDGLEFISLEDDVPAEHDIAVPPQKPDTAGKAVLKMGGFFHAVGRPILYVVNLLFAPVIKPFKKGADQVTRKDWCLFFMMLAAVGILIGAVNLSVWMKNRHHIKDAMYTISMGYKESWEGGKFAADKDGTTTFTSEDYSAVVNGQPYYYEEGNKMFLTTPYIWYPVEENLARAVERYSTLTLSAGAVRAELPGGTQEEIKGYLYDNRDTYIFLEPVYVTYDEETVRIPALSFVKTYSGGSADIYPYGSDQGYYVTYEKELTAAFENGAGIHMDADTMYYSNGISRLIQDSVEQLKMLGE